MAVCVIKIKIFVLSDMYILNIPVRVSYLPKHDACILNVLYKYFKMSYENFV